MIYLTNKDVAGDGPCALITALNAMVYYNIPLPSTHVIEILVDMVSCRYGSAINISAGWGALGLHVNWCQAENHDEKFEWVKKELTERKPVAIGAFSPDWGYHSSLVIGHIEDSLSLINWKKGEVISEVKWIDIEYPPCDDGPLSFYLAEKRCNLDLYPKEIVNA